MENRELEAEREKLNGRFFAGDSGPLLGKWDWGAFWLACIVSFIVYYFTLAPTVTLEDSGELAVAGDYLGVPHPPGYPLWTILAWLFARLFSFQHFHGQPNPAWSIGLMSAFFGALATGITAMLICRSGKSMLRGMTAKWRTDPGVTENLICFGGGVAGSLLFAFSPVMWSQALIAEVYTLNAFFVALILLLCYLWMLKPSNGLLFATAVAFGLGMANWWPSVLLTAGPLVFVLLFRDLKLCRDFAIVGAVLLVMILINVKLNRLKDVVHPNNPQEPLHPWVTKWMWLSGPSNGAFWGYTIINLCALALAWLLLPRGRTVAITFLLVELGLLVYLYMPLVSDLRNPPMNWGYPRTWEGFMHAVGRGQYEKVAPADIFSLKFLEQLGAYVTELRCQFTLPLALLGFLPFASWSVGVGKARISAMLPALVLAVSSVPMIAIEKVYGFGVIWNIRVYMVLIAGVLMLLVLGFAALILKTVRQFVDRIMGDDRDTGVVEKILLAVLLAIGAILFIVYELKWGKQLGQDLKYAQKLAIMAIMAAPVGLAGVVGWLMYGGLKMRFDVRDGAQKWMLVTALAFGLMSFAMVAAANPKGDIQDMFIQRVKFITSHAMYAFWIGYGIILGGAFVYKLLGQWKTLAFAGVALALVLPAYPVVQNAPYHVNKFNEEYLVMYGGTDQRGHDYGWQFGNYQLCGLGAITNELEAGAVPPPDTGYPAAMTTNAIFFGGTDPGRFVPTYMIYSARVREDVYLITQNALADHTYMSVMRDLYGDRIWIPAQADNNEAFRIYAEDVKAGRRKGTIDMRSGRLIVTGVESVMEINGILCEMIHQHNKHKHDFYVEESYVIPWMYPYMEPHGLVLKINAEKLDRIPAETIKNDMAFWKWYKDYLLNHEKFEHDAVAKKTFSKLRSAIAGLYEYRGLWEEAEIAYKEAAELCPVSPEAHFRLAGMYMRIGKFEDARKLMSGYQDRDPKNTKSADILEQIDERIAVKARMDELEAMLNSNKPMDFKLLMELMDLYLKVGHKNGVKALGEGVLADDKVPPDASLAVARRYAFAKMYDDMDGAIKVFFERAEGKQIPADYYRIVAETYALGGREWLPQASAYMVKYLQVRPFDANAWHELGVMYAYMGQNAQAVEALRQSVRIMGPQKLDDIRKDGRLAPLAGDAAFRSMFETGPSMPPGAAPGRGTPRF